MPQARRNGSSISVPSRSTAPVRRLLLIAVQNDGPEGGPSSLSGSRGGSNPVRRRVLVVEDDWLIATQIESCLAAVGFDVTGIAVGPQEAMRQVRAAPPHLVLMDIRLLDGADGVQLALDLWQDLGLRCLFVSANIDAGTEARAASARPLGWLAKPFTEAELIEAVSDAFDRLGSP